MPDQKFENFFFENKIIFLAGADLLSAEHLVSFEKACIGYSFIPSADNIADRVIRNIFIRSRTTKENMVTMNGFTDYLRDDMSVVVVEILILFCKSRCSVFILQVYSRTVITFFRCAGYRI